VVTWLENIRAAVEGVLSIRWKTYSLERQRRMQGQNLDSREIQDELSPGELALAASKAAQKHGEESFLKFHLEAFRAKHDDGEDLTDLKVIRSIASRSGLDLARFEHDLAEKDTRRAVVEDHMEARASHGVFGVPTLVFPGGSAVFVKLQSLPESLQERISLFEHIYEMAVRRPYLLELKRP
jgi:predicted DsbA family dithiol-disulfide isomerase